MRVYRVRTSLTLNSEATVIAFETFDNITDALHAIAIDRDFGLVSNLTSVPA